MKASLPAILVWMLIVRPAFAEKPEAAADGRAAETRALAFLAREVPQWHAANRCFSCHNNGDAARALYLARRQGIAVPAEALAGTTAWLARPDRWDENGGDGEFSDRRLATVQFAAALAAATEAGAVESREPLKAAARRLVEIQEPDGSWTIDGPETLGAPATYGRSLATALSRRTLAAVIVEDPAVRPSVERADHWLRAAKPQTVFDAAAVVFGLERATDDTAIAQRARCVEILRKGAADDGGWGPYITSPPEPFDTAVVLLALAPHESTDARDMVRAGRAFLVITQQPDGSWPETTRPSGATSYAQRISTTAWATMALTATRVEQADGDDECGER